ncbi:DUF1641 domain-containing protein [Pseudonocardia sp. GCM10023141]|uniref:DUF1641 domain-containing protein n=1 Tax=Pseudonocardia sp. GCM10023141 TaxID=3252653 RepID=UPI00360C97A5
MALNDPLAIRSPADDLLERLDEPKVVAALNTLLDHADLLAVAVVALDGFLSRGDVIADSLFDAVGELRGVTAGASGSLAGIDVKGVVNTVSTLAGPLVAATPALTTLLAGVSEPRTVAVVGQLTGAVADADRTASATGPSGAFALLRALKDPDVSRGLGFFLALVKAFGQRRAS